MILVIFTSSYPCDHSPERVFLETELKILSERFEKIILVPKTCSEKRLPILPDIELDRTYAASLQRIGVFHAVWNIIRSSFFYEELRSRPAILLQPSALARLARYLVVAMQTRAWVLAWSKRTGHDQSNVLFYTYWFDSAAMGIGLAKTEIPLLKVVSRAHGYDLYEDRYGVPYLPCRTQALERVDLVFPDSKAGVDYLHNLYPDFRSKVEMALLGVEESVEKSSASSDGVFRIVSCAVIRPVKRIELIMESVAWAARMRPSQRFEWHHFGNGQLPDAREDLQRRADEIFPANARARLPGYTNQEELLKLYREKPVDVFINASESEGTPVSIMEAISCGIPVIATAVGGNREIVTPQNGLLLSSNPEPEEIARAFFSLIDNPTDAMEKRKGSYKMWMEKYDAKKNFNLFADRLLTLRES